MGWKVLKGLTDCSPGDCEKGGSNDEFMPENELLGTFAESVVGKLTLRLSNELGVEIEDGR